MQEAQLHLFNCMTSGNPLDLSEPQCSDLSGGNNNNYLKGMTG